MSKLLFLLFIVLPLVELALLVTLSHYTSLFTTIAFILITGILGTLFIQRQGLSVLRRIQEETSGGKVPQEALLDGLLIVVAGVLMISPGVLTDVIGVLLLLPPVRFLVRRILVRWFRDHVTIVTSSSMHGSRSAGRSSDVIDVEAREVPDPPDAIE